MHVELGTGVRETLRVAEYISYYRQVRERFLQALGAVGRISPAPTKAGTLPRHIRGRAITAGSATSGGFAGRGWRRTTTSCSSPGSGAGRPSGSRRWNRDARRARGDAGDRQSALSTRAGYIRPLEQLAPDGMRPRPSRGSATRPGCSSTSVVTGERRVGRPAAGGGARATSASPLRTSAMCGSTSKGTRSTSPRAGSSTCSAGATAMATAPCGTEPPGRATATASGPIFERVRRLGRRAPRAYPGHARLPLRRATSPPRSAAHGRARHARARDRHLPARARCSSTCTGSSARRSAPPSTATRSRSSSSSTASSRSAERLRRRRVHRPVRAAGSRAATTRSSPGRGVQRGGLPLHRGAARLAARAPAGGGRARHRRSRAARRREARPRPRRRDDARAGARALREALLATARRKATPRVARGAAARLPPARGQAQWWWFFHLEIPTRSSIEDGDTIGWLEIDGEPEPDKQSLVYALASPRRSTRSTRGRRRSAHREGAPVSSRRRAGRRAARRGARTARRAAADALLVPGGADPARTSSAPRCARFAGTISPATVAARISSAPAPRAAARRRARPVSRSSTEQPARRRGSRAPTSSSRARPDRGRPGRGARLVVAPDQRRASASASPRRATRRSTSSSPRSSGDAREEGVAFRGVKKHTQTDDAYEGRAHRDQRRHGGRVLDPGVELVAGTSWLFARRGTRRDARHADRRRGRPGLARGRDRRRHVRAKPGPAGRPATARAGVAGRAPGEARACPCSSTCSARTQTDPRRRRGIFLEQHAAHAPRRLPLHLGGVLRGAPALDAPEPATRTTAAGDGLRLLAVAHEGNRVARRRRRAVAAEIERLLGTRTRTSDGRRGR